MPLTVTTRIKELLKQRDARIISGSQYVQELLAQVQREILAELVAMPSDSYSAFHLRQTMASIERYLSSFESGADRELSSGLTANWDMGTDLLSSTMHSAGGGSVYLGTPHLTGNVLDTLKEFTFGRVRSVSNDLFTRIKGELTLGILGQKTPAQIAAEIAGSLPGPSIFKTVAERAEVITGLEMGRAFSVANQASMESATDVLPALKKMWLHAGHPRAPRQTHLLMHGQTREMDAVFYQAKDGGAVRYPRDPQAPIQEVIRCGCDHIPYMDKWGDAATFAASWDQTQYQVNFKKAA